MGKEGCGRVKWEGGKGGMWGERGEGVSEERKEQGEVAVRGRQK